MHMLAAMGAVLAKTLQNHIRLLRGFQRVDKRMLSAWEIILLDINNQESCLHCHTVKYSRSRIKTESTSPVVAFLAATSGDIDSVYSFFLTDQITSFGIRSALCTFFTKSLATEAAIETLWSPPTIMALMPTTSPFALTSGPPELPGARGTSERTTGSLSPWRLCACTIALTMPRVTVLRWPHG